MLDDRRVTEPWVRCDGELLDELVVVVVPVSLAPRRVGMERNGGFEADALRGVVADETEYVVSVLNSTRRREVRSLVESDE
jgi:hypothetical protein